ncbi:DUF99 family protein [Halobaculum sp. MBLA0147]|uniref:endonuclease dU n=1 Tax=Halobaculum sp. MBLA0147 TaxID=3079934 RepID=UPI0035254B9B
MRSGTRAAGIAVSDGETTATVCGAVVRADRVLDGLAFGECTVGGTDATATVASLSVVADRPDVQYVLCAGLAPAWFNLLDLHRLHERADCPVLSVSFEASPGLDPALREQFDGDALAERRAIYERQPPRRRVVLDADAAETGTGEGSADAADAVWVRAVGCDHETAAAVVRAYTPAGSGRPEPLRVARLAARAGRTYGGDDE